MFDADELDITIADQASERAISEELAEKDPISELAQSLGAAQPLKSGRDIQEYLAIQEAKKRFDLKFFEQFAYEGASASKLSQRDLEQLWTTLSSQDQQQLVLSMLNSVYELNATIPNVELVFFKMFVSPLTTRA